MKPKDILKEKAIIDQTLKIVNESGIAGIKMSVLAKRVGISPSTLYVYFETKEDLIITIGSQLLKLIAKNREKYNGEDKPFKIRFKAKWIGMVNFNVTHKLEVNFIEQWKRSPYFNQKAQVVWKENKKNKDDLFEEGRRLGIFKQLDEKITFSIMFGFSNELANSIEQGSLELNQKTLDESFNVIWDALRS